MKDAIQDQLIAARKAQILEAAAKVFAAKGFHPATIRDVAKVAGIADGTIYNYFENKTALLLGIVDLMQQTARADMDVSMFSEPDFRRFLAAYLRPPLMIPKKDNFELFRVIISEIMVNEELRALYYQKVFEPAITTTEKYFEQWVARNTIKPVNIGLKMRAISGMLFGLILQNIMGDELLQTEWDNLPEFLTDMLFDGLKTESENL